MGRLKIHNSANERYTAHRNAKIRNSTNKTFCSVCNDYIQCSGDVEHALLQHQRSSKRHKELVHSKQSNHSHFATNVEESLQETEHDMGPISYQMLYK